MKLLLTGATGRIGQHVLEDLCHRGNNVCLLVRHESMAEKIRHLKSLEGATVRRTDLFDIESLKRATRGVDVVCHLAWATGSERERPDVAADMIRLTDRLLKASVDSGVRRFLFTSSVSVYGEEGSWRSMPISEHDPPGGRNLYARSKIKAENLIRHYGAEHKLQIAILRIALVYGRGVTYVERFIDHALTHPFLSRYWHDNSHMQLIHVRDAARALVVAATKSGGIDGIFNIAGNEVISGAELTQLINSLANQRLNWFGARSFAESAPHNRQLKYDISKAWRMLKFRPRVNLKQGFSEILSERRGY